MTAPEIVERARSLFERYRLQLVEQRRGSGIGKDADGAFLVNLASENFPRVR